MKKLKIIYYTFFVLAVATATFFWWFFVKQGNEGIEPLTTMGQVVQYIVIGYVLLSVSLGLYIFKRSCAKIKLIEDAAAKESKYVRNSTIRMVVIGLGMILGIAAFYLLKGYQSMIWCAAISAIGLYFCKPTERRMKLEIEEEDEQ